MLVDAGTVGTALRLDEQKRIRHILLSHLHHDHIQGLPTLADNLVDAPDEPVTLTSIPSVLKGLQTHVFNDKVYPNFLKLPDRRHPVFVCRSLKPGKESELSNRQRDGLWNDLGDADAARAFAAAAALAASPKQAVAVARERLKPAIAPDAKRMKEPLATPELARARAFFDEGNFASARAEAKRVRRSKEASAETRMEAGDLLDRTAIDQGPLAAAVGFLILLALLLMYVATNNS